MDRSEGTLSSVLALNARNHRKASGAVSPLLVLAFLQRLDDAAFPRLPRLGWTDPEGSPGWYRIDLTLGKGV